MIRDSETGLVFHKGAVWNSMWVPRMIQLVNLAFWGVYLLLGARFLVEYVAARPVPAVRFIERYSDYLYLPFKGIVPAGHDAAGHPIAWSLLIALGACAVVHGLLVSLLRSARPHVSG